MWYLLAAILGSSSLVIILKAFDLKGVNLYVGITVNYIVGALLAFLFAPERLSAAEIMKAEWLPIASLIGALFMLSFVVYAVSAQRSGVAITTISGRAAVVIPVIFAFVLFDEQPSAQKIGMLVLILLSMILILRKDKPVNMEGSPRDAVFNSIWILLLPLSVFLFNGLNDTLVQYAQRVKIPSETMIPVFTGTMFAAGAITGIIYYAMTCLKNPHKPNAKDLLWGSILGFMNWVCMIGVFNGLNYMDGSVFYPLYYTGAIVIATLAGVFVFKEKLSVINYIGIAIAIAAIAVLSMH